MANAEASNRDDRAALVAHLDELCVGPAWHGPSLLGSLRGVTPTIAIRRPGKGRHNIAEVVVHAAYWKYTVRRRLTGDARGSFALKGSNWFPRPTLNAAAWRADLELLQSEHDKLRAVVRAIEPAQLDRRLTGSQWTAAETIRGAAAHDAYHAGQIQLLKRLVGGRRQKP